MEGGVATIEHVDVLIVGAGLSGIGAGYRLQSMCPDRRYLILEGRSEIGGTWDLFRYPGIRSDSDMFTLGYPFRPWKDAKAIADGASILRYLKDTAREFGIDRHIRLQQRVCAAAYSSADGRWTLEVESGPEKTLRRYSCDFLYICSGYYDYAQGYTPDFPGRDQFQGLLVHPQQWPQELDCRGKRVVVIGSGATAVTLVPSLAAQGAQVTMLQRSPTYIADLPSTDSLADLLRRWLPERLAHRLARWKNVLLSLGIYQLCRRAPRLARKLFRWTAARHLPQGYDLDTHFNPRYEPWDQRLCLVPDADLFKSIASGQADVVTEQIDHLSAHGIRLRSGRELPADIVVTATGLQLQLCGGMRISVDGHAVDAGAHFAYKGLMLSNVPNFAFCIGYVNASWTLRADLSSRFVCRLLRHMRRKGYRQCVPRADHAQLEPQPLLGLNSGYFTRAYDFLPKQGPHKPWRVPQNYLLDIKAMSFGRLDDGVLQFSREGAPHSVPADGAIA